MNTLGNAKDDEAKLEDVEKSNQENLIDASKKFISGWGHFLNCIDFGKSWLDAEAIRFMNEVPGQIEKAIRELKND